MRNSPMSEPRFRAIEPKILYFGTPVAFNRFAERRRRNEPGADIVILDAGVDDCAGIARRNEDGRQRAATSGVCGEFTPRPEMWEQVERLAPLTGKNPVPELGPSSSTSRRRNSKQPG